MDGVQVPANFAKFVPLPKKRRIFTDTDLRGKEKKVDKQKSSAGYMGSFRKAAATESRMPCGRKKRETNGTRATRNPRMIAHRHRSHHQLPAFGLQAGHVQHPHVP